MDHSLTPTGVTRMIDMFTFKGVIKMSDTARDAGTPNKIPWNRVAYVPQHQG